MQGYSTLWLPGEDHASIATEVKVENELLKLVLKKKKWEESFSWKKYGNGQMNIEKNKNN